MRQGLVRLARGALPPAVKRVLQKLSVSHAVEGNMYFHIGHLQRLGYAPAVVADVGAFEGEWTTNVLDIFPSGDGTLFQLDLLFARADNDIRLRENTFA